MAYFVGLDLQDRGSLPVEPTAYPELCTSLPFRPRPMASRGLEGTAEDPGHENKDSIPRTNINYFICHVVNKTNIRIRPKATIFVGLSKAQL